VYDEAYHCIIQFFIRKSERAPDVEARSDPNRTVPLEKLGKLIPDVISVNRDFILTVFVPPSLDEKPITNSPEHIFGGVLSSDAEGYHRSKEMEVLTIHRIKMPG